jgi:hypothetical protein
MYWSGITAVGVLGAADPLSEAAGEVLSCWAITTALEASNVAPASESKSAKRLKVRVQPIPMCFFSPVR